MTCPNCARLEAANAAMAAALRAEEESLAHDADCADCDRLREEQTDCYAHTRCPESLRLGHHTYDLRKTALSDAGKGWLPPEAREQVRRALRVAQSWIRSQESGDPARPSILVELATALDALKGVE